MGDRSRGVTISDVATHAGVSPASVSRVLNGRASVDPDIVRRVQASIATLGYAPSATARSLVSGRNATVAMVVPDLGNPLFQGILKGLSLAAADDGYRVLLADTAERVEDEETTAIEARQRCDALVLCAPRMPEAKLRRLVERVAPVVVVNRPLPDLAVPIVGVDYVRGIRDLVEHLVGLGHRHLAYVAGPETSASNAERVRGVEEAVAMHPSVRIERIAGGSRPEDGEAVAPAVVDAHRAGVTAVLAFNDLVALGLLTRLRELGVDVPGELSVAGFDDVPMARYATPRLTSMSVPRTELGAQVWARLRTLIAGGPVEHTMLYRPRLEARESTAAPSARPAAAAGGASA
ncbi:LacI family DNA-binding transcriptional regulator [Agromyces sp. GXS1127]|uniref:LacI family DNA-binding transcriptional regulator n=1 Tax=Agromyces sp. GXS1127 TaxID=3424181 RepID=UPI003D316B75